MESISSIQESKVVTILKAKADNATMQHDYPYYGGLVILLFNWATFLTWVIMKKKYTNPRYLK